MQSYQQGYWFHSLSSTLSLLPYRRPLTNDELKLRAAGAKWGHDKGIADRSQKVVKFVAIQHLFNLCTTEQANLISHGASQQWAQLFLHSSTMYVPIFQPTSTFPYWLLRHRTDGALPVQLGPQP